MPADCMDKYKNDFAIKFAKIMQQQLDIWKDVQNSNRLSLLSLQSFGFYFFIAALGMVPGKNEHNYNLKFHLILAAVCFIAAVISNIHSTNKTYQDTIKATLFPELLKIFGNLQYRSSSSLTSKLNASSIILDDETDNAASLARKTTDNNIIYDIKSSVFQNSQLYDKKITERTDDDAFYGTYNDVALTMVETDFGWNAKDRYRTYHRMFKGLAMRFKMNKKIKSRVLILTKFSMTKIPKGFEKVELESVKFNKKYNVWVDSQSAKGEGQIEARYLLNTAFLERLMQIQTSFRVHQMCCSIFGNSMLVMLHTRKDLFEMNHLFGRIDDTTQYRHLFNEFASVLSFIDVLNLSSKTKL